MELLISLADGGRVDDLAVVVDPQEPVGEVARQLGASIGRSDGPLTIRCLRRSIVLDPAAPVDDSGIRTGDVVSLEPISSTDGFTSTRPRSLYELVLTEGPRAGTRLPLDAGRFVIGRASDADVVVDDEAMSRRHAALEIGTALALTDLGSTNGTFVNGAQLAANEANAIHLGDEITFGDTAAHVEVTSDLEHPIRLEHGSLRFNRPPRVFRPYAGRKFDLPAPPPPPRKSRLPWVSALVPLLMAFAMLGISKATGAGGFQIFSLIFFLMTPLMVVGSYFEAKRSGRLDHRSALADFERRLEQVTQDLEVERSVEVKERLAESPDPVECKKMVAELSPHLWERGPDDSDFCAVRLGLATLPSASTVDRATAQDSAADERLAAIEAHAASVAGVPLVVDLPTLGGIGIAADPTTSSAIGSWILLQMATEHSPIDLVIMALVGDEAMSTWDWIKWLPHTRSSTSPLSGSHIAHGRPGIHDAVERLKGLMAERRDKAAFAATTAQAPLVLLFVHESVEVDLTVLAPVLEGGPDVGIHHVFVGSTPSEIPRSCGVVVAADREPGRPSSRVGFRGGEVHHDVLVDRVSFDTANEWARQLAPLTDAARRQSKEGTLPRSVNLVSVLGDDDALLTDPGAILARWNRSQATLGAPVGRTGNDVFTIDLRADGPHGLVGGTTGSGKSELLQTFVASLAASYPPTQVSFILVDYKGGSAFKECVALPHTAGFVTDLDGHLVERARVSLASELRRREELFARHGAKDIIDMQRKAPSDAPPALVIVIDEFAALVSDVPEFVEGVIDLAQRGRSLGVHLLLATQSPGQVVSQRVRDNSSIRVALRVQNSEASQAVIDSPVAASIPDDIPGRAISRLGGRELIEFQAAFAGAQSVGTSKKVALTVTPFGAARPSQAPARVSLDPTSPTDLQRLTENILAASKIAGVPRVRRPWLPPLPAKVAFEKLPRSSDHRLVIGARDLPAQQRQEPFVVDLAADGNLAIFGAGGSGRTSSLRTIAAAAAAAAGPEDLVLYAIDASARGLAVLAELPHTGSVIDAADEERVVRLIRRLQRELGHRAERFAEARVGSIDELRSRAPAPAMPRIIVLIDNLPALISAYDAVDGGAVVDGLEALLKDGRAAGIHFVVTADRPPSSSIATAFPRRIVLRLATEADYVTFGIPVRTIDRNPPPGRGIVDGTEVQIAAIAGRGGVSVEAFSDFAQSLAVAHAPVSGHTIGALPSQVASGALPPPARPWQAFVGIADETLAPVGIDLSDDNFLIAGPIRSGRSTAALTLTRSLAISPGAPRIWLVTGRRSPLTSEPWFERILDRPDDAASTLHELAESIRDRGLDHGCCIVVDDVTDLVDTDVDRELADLARLGRDHDIRLIVTGEAVAVRRAYSGVLPEIRKFRSGLLLQPDLDLDGDLLAVRLPRRTRGSFGPGRGFLTQRDTLQLVQVAS